MHLSISDRKYTYKKYKCKVLFNTPYLSEFNCIELLFRFIKNIYYKHLYNSIEQLEEHVRSIIDNINETIEWYNSVE